MNGFCSEKYNLIMCVAADSHVQGSGQQAYLLADYLWAPSRDCLHQKIELRVCVEVAEVSIVQQLRSCANIKVLSISLQLSLTLQLSLSPTLSLLFFLSPTLSSLLLTLSLLFSLSLLLSLSLSLLLSLYLSLVNSTWHKITPIQLDHCFSHTPCWPLHIQCSTNWFIECLQVSVWVDCWRNTAPTPLRAALLRYEPYLPNKGDILLLRK